MDSLLTSNNFEGPSKKRPLSSFIRKLWFILAELEYEQFIFWVDHGQVICIPNSISFSQSILPKFFKHNNWQSFVRQLNLYGFRKVYQLNLSYDDSLEKRTVWHFKHDCFQKNKPEKLYDIKRRTNKSEDMRETSQTKSDDGHMEYTTSELNKSITKELSDVKLKLDQVDNKREDLSKELTYLSELQSNQQETINVLSQIILHIVDNNPSINVKGKKYTDIVNTLVTKSTMNQQLIDLFKNAKNERMAENSIDSNELQSDEESQESENHLSLKRKNIKSPGAENYTSYSSIESNKSYIHQFSGQSQQPFKSLQSPSKQIRLNNRIHQKSLPSISFLFREESNEVLPPIKRHKVVYP